MVVSLPAVDSLADALASFRDGNPVLVHDAAEREGETDLIYPARAVGIQDVVRVRNDAGGMVCVAVSHRVAQAFDLPFFQEAVDHPATLDPDLAYDDRSSFSLSVNHRDTRTGVTDRDRALTIAELGRASSNPEGYPFAESFRSPGHVHVLRAAEGLLSERQGHTELGVALARKAGCAPAVLLCEMLDDETGDALPPEKARSYAERHGAPYLEGAHLVSELADPAR